MTRRAGLPALLLLLALGTAACGGSDSPADPPAAADQGVPADPFGSTEDGSAATTEPAVPELDACELVTRAEAVALATTPLNAGVPAQDTCVYTGPVTGPTAQVEVAFGDGSKKFLDIDRTLGHEFRALPGVGDEAWAESGTVFVRKGTVWASVNLVRLNDPAENKAALEKVAAIVAGRL